MRLDDLTLFDIQRDYGGSAVYERGEDYYRRGLVQDRVRTGDGLRARVMGTQTYVVNIREHEGELLASCSCPYGLHWGGDCKHIIATLLAWVQEPESFRRVADWRAVLAAKSKEELLQILTDICQAYPHLIEEYGLEVEEPETYDPQAAVRSVFQAYEPPYGIDNDEMLRRLQLIARKAASFEERGQHDLARRTYFALIMGCLNCADDYGTGEMFPDDIPYEYAERYVEIVQKHGRTPEVERELAAMLRSEMGEVMGVADVLWELSSE